MEEQKGITIQVLNEADDFFRLLWYMQKRKFITTGIVILAILGSFVFTAMMSVPQDHAEDNRWILHIVIVVFPLIFCLFIYFSLKSNADKLAEGSESSTIRFDSDGIEISSLRSSANSSWSSFDKVVETPSDFIFYPQPHVSFGIPKRFFENDLQIENLRTLLVRNLDDKAALRLPRSG